MARKPVVGGRPPSGGSASYRSASWSPAALASAVMAIVLCTWALSGGLESRAIGAEEELEALRYKLELKATHCDTALDCELNGECIEGKCVCDAAWTGPACSELALLPAKAGEGIRHEGVTTWGGNVIEQGGKFHFFHSEIPGECGLKAWHRNSRVVRAEAGTVNGPFRRKEVVLPTFAHNPQVVRAHDDTLLLFHIGDATGREPVLCHPGNGTTPCDFAAPQLERPRAQGTSFRRRTDVAREDKKQHTFPVHVSKSVDGPWEKHDVNISFNVGPNANPSPVVLPNGTTLVLFHSFNPDMAIAEADHWSGPYRLRSSGACGKGEDPFLYVDRRGNFHCLAHAAPFNKPTRSIVHSYSVDGFTWHISKHTAGGSLVRYDNGQHVLFSKRERPKLLFDDQGNISHLITGVTLTPNCAPRFLYPRFGVDKLAADCFDESRQYWLTNHNPCPGYYDLAFTHVQRVRQPKP